MQTTFGRYFFRLASALVVVAPAAGLCAPAERGSASNNSVGREDAPSEEVSFADLDLRQSADQNKLKQRIRLAAVRVCNFDGFLSAACVDIASVDALNQAHRLAEGNASIGATAATVLIVSGVRH